MKKLKVIKELQWYQPFDIVITHACGFKKAL